MIQIGETGYYVDSTPNCITLVRWDGLWITRPDGKQERTRVTMWYYSNLESMLTGLAEKMTLDAVQRIEYMRDLKTALGDIKRVIEKFAKDIAPNIDTNESEDNDE